MDRVAFMKEVWTVVQSYGTQSILKIVLNRPLMRAVLDKLDECEGRLTELLINSATNEKEANSPIKMNKDDTARIQGRSSISVKNPKENDAIKDGD